MKKLLLLALSTAVALSAHTAEAARRRPASVPGCRTVQSVQSGGIYIYKNSAPLRSGGIGTPIVGFRNEPTLIMNRNVSSRGTATIFDTKGNKIGSCPWASAHGHAGGRYRCTMQTSSLRRAAMSQTRSATVLFKISPSLCVSVPDAGRCYGSVKGRCNQLIR